MLNQSKRLIILHSNDLHSCFDNMPKIATAIDEYRSQYAAEDLLLIDCGDHLDRMSMETEGSAGLANVDVMNATGYEVFVPGNNEGLTFPKHVFEEAFRDRAQFEVLACNMFELESGRVPAWMSPWRIMDKGGLKVGIIGLTASYNDFYNPLGWDIQDPFELARITVDLLRPQVNFLILVSHLGLGIDQRMAAEIPGIDCILGGHTHHLLEQAIMVGHTLIGAAGKLGNHLGVVELEYDMLHHQRSRLAGYTKDVTSLSNSLRISSIIENYRESSQAVLNKQVAHLYEPLSNNWQEESELGNLLADGIRNWTNSEVGLVNAGQLLDSLSAGGITDYHLLMICPSPINPCSLFLTGAQIVQALEEALLLEFIDKPIRGFGFRGKVLGTLCLSGLDVQYDASSPPYQKIVNVRINNENITIDRCYKVGTIDMFTFGAGYTSLGKGLDKHYYLPEFIRDVLRRQLVDHEAIALSRCSRWKAVVS
ncbi:MAG: bifunctional UDP-sugar hydrolase/5'-nucleotidase [Paenibacillaceae bacterium]